MQIFAKTRLTAMAMALAGAGFMVGCGSSVPNASPIIENPTSDVTGYVVDAMTQEPIVGAKVIVEGYNISAKTDDEGRYLIKDVPNTAGASMHTVSIDMAKVTSPVVMADKSKCTPADATADTAAVICNFYPDVAMNRTMAVVGAGDNGAGIGYIGMLTNKMYMVGKATAELTGYVYDEDGITPVGDTVVHIGPDEVNNTTGAAGADGKIDNVWGTMVTAAADDTATADENELGMFHFHGLEARSTYIINAYTKDKMMTFTSGAINMVEGATINLESEGNARVILAAAANTAPKLVAISHDGVAEVDAAGAASVTWSFDESIAADAAGYRDSIAAGGNLHNDVVVTYDGAKAGNVAYTVAWNDDFNELTVSVPTVKEGSKYSFDISTVRPKLEDSDGGTATNPAAAVAESVTVSTSGGNIAITGAPTAASIDVLANVDWNTATANLVWTKINGAKSYNVYANVTTGADTVQVFAGNTTARAMAVGLGNFAGASWESNFVTDVLDPLAVSYTFQVAAVDNDGTQGDLSTATAAYKDLVAPTITTTGTDCSAGTSPYGGDVVTVNYDEPMDATTVTTAANYAAVPGTPKAYEYDEATYVVSIMYDVTTICPTPTTVTVTGAKDIAGNTIVAASNAAVW